MAKILYIQASPMAERSYSIRTARFFLEAYQAANPRDVIEELDLWKTALPAFDAAAASGKYKIMRGLPHTAEEASAWTGVVQVIDQLKTADKLVVSSGMWNFSIPYRLKQYIDIIVQPGFTFTFDADKGYSGLVKGKPLQLLLASGGEYPDGTPMAAFDFQKPYLEMIFRFIGFTDIRSLRVEGTLSPAAQDNLKKIKTSAMEAGQRF
ncbi:MAG: NAD(P)H-dependent oxidoreductase [Thermodesulfobacteriota bacterium]